MDTDFRSPVSVLIRDIFGLLRHESLDGHTRSGSATVNHAMSDLLFTVIVGWLYIACEHESEIVFRQIVLSGLLCIVFDIIDDCEPRSKISWFNGKWKCRSKAKHGSAERH